MSCKYKRKTDTVYHYSNELDCEKAISLFKAGTLLKDIAFQLNTSVHILRELMKKRGISTSRKGKNRPPFTERHKENMRRAFKGRVSSQKGKKQSKIHMYKNMRAHLKYKVELEFLLQFEDIEKLKYLNKVFRWERVPETWGETEYRKFIELFYNDEQFNRYYERYLKSGKLQYLKPSIDHIVPTSKGGTWEFNNLQMLPWCINRAKHNFSCEEWKNIITLIKEEF